MQHTQLTVLVTMVAVPWAVVGGLWRLSSPAACHAVIDLWRMFDQRQEPGRLAGW